jgi:peptidoglycan hydrolase CwlO-like protein
VRFKLIFLIAGIYLVFIGGCVSKAQLDTVNTDYRIAQEQLAEREKRGAELQRVLEDSKKEIDQCLLDQDALMKQQNALKKQIDTMRDTNNLLSLKIDALNQTITQKENVISLQKTVIRMFDDSDQTLQTSIKEQSGSLE